jgi:ABC-type spermidine/putrescine transport system permease subunit II
VQGGDQAQPAPTVGTRKHVNLALFLAGANAASLPVYIFSQIQFEADPSIAAASALQIVIVGGLILLVQRPFHLRLMA